MRFIEFIVVRAKGNYCSASLIPFRFSLWLTAKVQDFTVVPFHKGSTFTVPKYEQTLHHYLHINNTVAVATATKPP